MTKPAPNSKVRRIGLPRWGRRSIRPLALASIVVTLVLSACSSTGTVDIESIGMSVETDVQAGTELEFVFLAPADMTIGIESVPEGVDARIERTSDDGAHRLTVAVATTTPRGAYNLGIAVVTGDETTVLGWPFDVVDS